VYIVRTVSKTTMIENGKGIRKEVQSTWSVPAFDKLRLASLPKMPRSSTYAPVRLRSRYFRRLAILVSEQPWLENGPLIILSASHLNDRRISSATKNVRHNSGSASRRPRKAFLFKDDFCSSNDSSNFG
jgi:hypothetical protein